MTEYEFYESALMLIRETYKELFLTMQPKAGLYHDICLTIYFSVVNIW